MAWLNSIHSLPEKPFDIGFIPNSENELQKWLFVNWDIVFTFKFWVREFFYSERCKVDFVGYDEFWKNGYLVELKIGPYRKIHKTQVDRYLEKISNSKSWTKCVDWHGLLICCDKGKLYPYFIGTKIGLD